MAASQIFASGVLAEEDGVALDVEEETTALELVTTEEVVVEVLALDEVINVLVTLDVIFSGEQLASNVNKRKGMMFFILMNILKPWLQ
jgi:hypothetical protein